MAQKEGQPRWWLWLSAVLILAILVAGVLLWWQPNFGLVTDQERVRAWVEDAGAWGPAAIILLELSQTILAPIPGQAIEAVSGYLFGPWLGALYAMIGIAAGSFTMFFLARRFGRPLAGRLFGGGAMARLDDLAARGGALFFFLLWLFPFVPDDLACMAAGLTPMRLRQFAFLMFLGRFPGIFVSVWIGANVAQVKPVWWVVLFAALTLIAVLVWRRGDQIQATILDFIERISNRGRSQSP
jgi:uncharacterized membrane protein YdjX (TVP38/TMEM64 family)